MGPIAPHPTARWLLVGVALGALYLAATPAHYLSVRSASGGFPANRHFFAEFKDLVRRPTAPEMVVVRCEVERTPRVVPGLGEIAQQQRVASAMHRDGTREAAELLLVHDHHRQAVTAGTGPELAERVRAGDQCSAGGRVDGDVPAGLQPGPTPWAADQLVR